MTLEEFKKKAKEIGWYVFDTPTEKWSEKIGNKWCFVDDGTVKYEDRVVASDRTIDQMWKIMEALQ